MVLVILKPTVNRLFLSALLSCDPPFCSYRHPERRWPHIHASSFLLSYSFCSLPLPWVRLHTLSLPFARFLLSKDAVTLRNMRDTGNKSMWSWAASVRSQHSAFSYSSGAWRLAGSLIHTVPATAVKALVSLFRFILQHLLSLHSLFSLPCVRFLVLLFLFLLAITRIWSLWLGPRLSSPPGVNR